MLTKKLINDPRFVVEEMLAGALAAHPHLLVQLPHSPRSIIAPTGRGPARSAW